MYIRYQDRLEMMEKAAMLNALRTGVTTVARAAKPMLTRAGSSLRTLGSDFAGRFKAGLGGLRDAASTARSAYDMNRLMGNGVWSSMRGAAGNFRRLAATPMENIGNSVKAFGRGIKNEAAPWLRNAGQSARSAYNMLPGAQQNAIKGTALAAGTLGGGYALGRATAPSAPAPEPVDPYADMG